MVILVVEGTHDHDHDDASLPSRRLPTCVGKTRVAMGGHPILGIFAEPGLNKYQKGKEVHVVYDPKDRTRRIDFDKARTEIIEMGAP